MIKRLFDIAVGATAIFVLLPLCLFVAFIIVLLDGRPVLFTQKRCGRNAELFDIYKFRTMKPADVHNFGVTVAGDSRVTRLGALLRRTKLDEFPQFYNVLIGDMSLVGPRPELPEFVAAWPARDRELVLSIRPGLTDPATLQFLNEEEFLASSIEPQKAYLEEILPRKLAMYRDYVETRTFPGDMAILVRTGMMVLRRIGGLAFR